MKMRMLGLALLVLVVTGCIKTIASEEEITRPEKLHNLPLGASARDFLSAEKYTSLKIEVQYMKGYKPDEDALLRLRKFLKTYLKKPDGISIVTKEIPPLADTVFRRDEFLSFEKINRTAYTNGSQLAVYILYTNGSYNESQSTFGLAYRNTSAVLFGKTIRENSGAIGKPSREKVETTVLLHEFGHLLGLVNTASSMHSGRTDEGKHHHCSNRKCLMYYGIETKDPVGYLFRGGIPTLDEACREDLKAIAGN